MIDLKETFHSISLKRKTYFDMMLEGIELSLMEVEILFFLKEYPENNTFTEIMRSKDYAKSYVSKAISNLLELGYLEKQMVPTNKKMYKLFLLEKSERAIQEYSACVKRFREDAFAGIAEEDYKVFERVIKQLSDNLSER